MLVCNVATFQHATAHITRFPIYTMLPRANIGMQHEYGMSNNGVVGLPMTVFPPHGPGRVARHMGSCKHGANMLKPRKSLRDNDIHVSIYVECVLLR